MPGWSGYVCETTESVGYFILIGDSLKKAPSEGALSIQPFFIRLIKRSLFGKLLRDDLLRLKRLIQRFIDDKIGREHDEPETGDQAQKDRGREQKYHE